MSKLHGMGTAWSQCFPTSPKFTSKSVPNLSDKVFIVTGGASGIGFELSKILYEHDGTVYIAARSSDKVSLAIQLIKTALPASKGKIHFLHLDLADLTGIKKSADEFLQREEKLDVLWNNAGVLTPPAGSTTQQGYELQLGTNCIGPFLFTQILLPLLKQTASSASSSQGSVRVVWTGSLAIDLGTPAGGMDLDDLNLNHQKGLSQMYLYSQSKCGNLFLGSELARRTAGDGIISVTINPGNLVSPLQRNIPAWQRYLVRLLAYHPILGAYTGLFAGLSPKITMGQNGCYIVPWGRLAEIRADIVPELMDKADGMAGKARRFWDYCETETRQYW